MSQKNIRLSGDILGLVNRVQNVKVSNSAVPTIEDKDVKMLGMTSTPKRTLRNQTPWNMKCPGIDESHLLSVQQLRCIFSPSRRAAKPDGDFQKMTTRIVVTKPQPKIANKKSPRKVRIISSVKLAAEQKINVKKSSPTREKHEDNSVIIVEETKPKNRVPFYYLGKCAKERRY